MAGKNRNEPLRAPPPPLAPSHLSSLPAAFPPPGSVPGHRGPSPGCPGRVPPEAGGFAPSGGECGTSGCIISKTASPAEHLPQKSEPHCVTEAEKGFVGHSELWGKPTEVEGRGQLLVVASSHSGDGHGKEVVPGTTAGFPSLKLHTIVLTAKDPEVKAIANPKWTAFSFGLRKHACVKTKTSVILFKYSKIPATKQNLLLRDQQHTGMRYTLKAR
ncbi:uncharacterized protein LOC115335610 isoform X2 [Aquila chrysaetos chrysaetos]|uniref:uncharacterized protein LOC115335610 isoform X2 n=1 Tax=Aquila chrysaetos chrysaetos TaxID=223781 RepID=UPI0011771008|nr:uncharacterized protein LOC115335610 isoform X2 [Aquila chrysaetos chrysaetos]